MGDTVGPVTSLLLFQVTGQLVGELWDPLEASLAPTLTPNRHISSCTAPWPALRPGEQKAALVVFSGLSLPPSACVDGGRCGRQELLRGPPRVPGQLMGGEGPC